MTPTTERSKGRSELGDLDFLPAYTRLRTVLDGLEINALRYCLRAQSVERRIELALEIAEALMPLVQKYQFKGGPPGNEGCPEGYVDCNGVCVPYQCAFTGEVD
jgi:hypothetical protein